MGEGRGHALPHPSMPALSPSATRRTSLFPRSFSVSPQQLRQIGISARKAFYLHDLAGKYHSSILSDSSFVYMDEKSLFSMLTMVKGIDAWSFHMFMIFSLHRPDVVPIGILHQEASSSLAFPGKDRSERKELECRNHLVELERLGCTLLHGIGVTDMNEDSFLKAKRFDRIIFNFPHAGHDVVLREEDEELILGQEVDV